MNFFVFVDVCIPFNIFYKYRMVTKYVNIISHWKYQEQTECPNSTYVEPATIFNASRLVPHVNSSF